jgi:trimeric autotransporter adhesin
MRARNTPVAVILVLLLEFQRAALGQGVLTTIAGTDWLFPADGRPALDAPLNGGTGLDIAFDKTGNLYIADDGNEMILRVGPDGIINVLAGNSIPFSSGDGGLAINAGVLSPLSVAVDNAGNVFFSQYGGDIRKVTPDGIVTSIAGTGATGFSGDGGPAKNAQLYGPYGLAVDSAGNIFIADTYNQRIRKITPDGVIHTIAGGGTTTGEGIPATSAKLNNPTRIALDAAGNLYITDTLANRILRVDTRGILTTVAGGGSSLSDGIRATTAAILPVGITVDGAGNLYIVDWYVGGIRKVDTQGIISTIAGNGKQGFSGDGGPALQASFHFGIYSGLTFDPAGNLYVADDANARIRRISGGQINTVAGNGLFHFSGNNGAATTATLDFPTGLTGDKTGNLYFTEPFVNRVRRIAPDGTISVFAGTGTLGYSGDGGPATAANLAIPEHLAIAPDGRLYFADTVNCVIRAIDSAGNIATVAGSGECGFNGDLQNVTKSSFKAPEAIDFTAAGDLIIADTQNHRIRAVLATGAQAGSVATLAGTGVAGYSGDGGFAPNTAQVNLPIGVRVHGNGVYFCDSGNNVVRYIDFSTLTVITVAGNGRAAYAGDGGPATRASLNSPTRVIFDALGNMYIADTNNGLIRKVDSLGTITTFAGRYGSSDAADGQSPVSGFIGAPSDLFFRANGNLVFTDTFSQRVREILNTPPAVQATPANLAFTAAAGSAAVDQGIDVSGSIPGIPFTISTGSSTWLSASVSAGRMPANVRIAADPSSLAPGTYTGTVTIAAPNANPAAIGVPVSLTVTAAGQPSLSVSPTSLVFPFVPQAPAASRPVSVSNTGGGSISFAAVPATTSGGSWLQVSPASGTLNGFASTGINITASPAGLGPGTYSGAVTVSSIGGAQSILVPVTMTVTAVSQTILIPQTGLSFFTVQGGGSPPPQNFNILNTGLGQMPWTVSTNTLAGGPWLSAFPRSGQTDAASPIVPQIRVDVNPQGLSAGTYYGRVQVSATGATNDPQIVSVILTVLPPGSNLGPIVQPTGLIFTAVAGAESPGSQTVTVQSTSSTPVNFTSGRITGSATPWFQSAPSAGTVTQSQPGRIVIQPTTSGLAPNVYRGSVTLTFSDGSTRAISLLLVVISAGTSLPAGTLSARFSPRDATAVCKPTTLAPIFTDLSEGSVIPAGYPGQVGVRVVDDCGNPMTTGGVTTTFSNADPPLRLTSLKNGAWAATWIPRHPASEVVVTATATIPEQNLTGQAQIKVGYSTADSPPVINQDGVVSAASFASPAPLAPGTLVALFGSKLSQGAAAATDFPLPINLAGSTIFVGGKEAPLLYSSDGQVNAMVPFDIAVNTGHQVIATRGTSISVPQTVTLAPTAPGIFTLPNSKRAIVADVDLEGNSIIVDATHPAKVGHALVIYCTGLGVVDPPVTAGIPAPLNPLSYTVNKVTVTIGGIDALVYFSGLTPTLSGLYQVNVRIPDGVVPGTEVPVILAAAGQFSPVATVPIQ